MATALSRRLSKTGQHAKQWQPGDIRDELMRLGVHPLLGMAAIAINEVPCAHCQHGGHRGKERYLLANPKKCRCCLDDPDDPRPSANCWRCNGEGIAQYGERICQSCKGSGMEAVCVETKLKALSELAKYTATPLKAVEVAQDGTAKQQEIVVHFVKTPEEAERFSLEAAAEAIEGEE